MKRLVAMVFLTQIVYICNSQDVKHYTVEKSQLYTNESSVIIAKAELLAMARTSAFEKTLPRSKTLSTVVSDLQVNNDHVIDVNSARQVFGASSMAAYFADERIETLQSFHDFNRYNLNLKYKIGIRPLLTNRNPYLDLDVQLNNYTIRENQNYTVSVTPSLGGYLYIFRFLPDSTVKMCYPDSSVKESYIESLTHKEIQITAGALPKANDSSIETLYIVFATIENNSWDKLKKSLFNSESEDVVIKSGNDSFAIFQKWFNRFKTDHYIEKMAQVQIIN